MSPEPANQTEAEALATTPPAGGMNAGHFDEGEIVQVGAAAGEVREGVQVQPGQVAVIHEDGTASVEPGPGNFPAGELPGQDVAGVNPVAAAAAVPATPAKVETATAPAVETPEAPIILPREVAEGAKRVKGFTRVRNLTAWGGVDFSFGAGAILDLPSQMAKDRAEAGLVEIL